MRIRKLAPSGRVEGRWLCHLEDGTILRLGESEVVAFGLGTGKELSGAELSALTEAARAAQVREKAVELLRSREASTNTKADIHELDTAYLAACRACALQAAEQLGWHVVHCLDDAGRLRSIEDIHSEIWALVEKEL